MEKIDFDSLKRDNIVIENSTGEEFTFISYNGGPDGQCINLKRKNGEKFSPSAKDKTRFSFYVYSPTTTKTTKQANSGCSYISVSSYKQDKQQSPLRLQFESPEKLIEKQNKQIEELHLKIEILKNEKSNNMANIELLNEKDKRIKDLEFQNTRLKFEKLNEQEQNLEENTQLIQELKFEKSNSIITLKKTKDLEYQITQLYFEKSINLKEFEKQITKLEIEKSNNYERQQKQIKELDYQIMKLQNQILEKDNHYQAAREFSNQMLNEKNEFKRQCESYKEQIKLSELRINALKLNESKRIDDHLKTINNYQQQAQDLYNKIHQLQQDNLTISHQYTNEKNKNQKEREEMKQREQKRIDDHLKTINNYQKQAQDLYNKIHQLQQDNLTISHQYTNEKNKNQKEREETKQTEQDRKEQDEIKQKERNEKEEMEERYKHYREQYEAKQREKEERDNQDKHDKEQEQDEINQREREEQERKEKEEMKQREQDRKEQEEIKQRDKDEKERKQKEKQEKEDAEKLKKSKEQQDFLNKVNTAKKPEDIFDKATDLKTQRNQYLKLIHPDKSQNYSDLIHKFNDAYLILNLKLARSNSSYFNSPNK